VYILYPSPSTAFDTPRHSGVLLPGFALVFSFRTTISTRSRPVVRSVSCRFSVPSSPPRTHPARRRRGARLPSSQVLPELHHRRLYMLPFPSAPDFPAPPHRPGPSPPRTHPARRRPSPVVADPGGASSQPFLSAPLSIRIRFPMPLPHSAVVGSVL
jgi:hypothetical protein